MCEIFGSARGNVREEVVLNLVGEATAVPVQQTALGAEVARGLELVTLGSSAMTAPFSAGM